MKLCIINGSPRSEEGNTRILLDHFIEGFLKASASNKAMVNYIGRSSIISKAIEAFNQADYCLIAFPLYTDAMPANVKYFFEQIDDAKGKQLLFLIQGGFPESIHCNVIKRYVKRLSERLGANFIGVVTKGNAEGLKDKPKSWTKKLRRQFHDLGYNFGQNGKLDDKIVQKLSQPYKMRKLSSIVMNIFNKAGLFNLYWDQNLKKNGAFDERFNQPYSKKD